MPAAENQPPLPKFRIETCPAFTVTSVDAAGPIPVKTEDKRIVSAHIMLFVCPVTRACRLEMVHNLTTYEFLLALRRFYNRNPTVTQFFSDNAASFRRAAKEVKLLFDLARSGETQGFLSEKGITWVFNTARAPWRSGHVERVVGIIKRPLRKIIGKNIPLERDFATLLTDIEKITNDRPLTYANSGADEMLPLTPSDLLYGNKAQPVLPSTEDYVEAAGLMAPCVLSERWKFQQNIISAYWNRFRREYLQQLRSAHAATPSRKRKIKEGDVVLIDDPAASRSRWPMARVLKLCGGETTDGTRRTCIVKLSSGKILTRPMQLLYPLDLDHF